MRVNNQEIYNFYSVFFVFALIILVFLASLSYASRVQNSYIEPLSIQQQEAIVGQIGIDGYKRLIKVKCYNSIVVRVRTERWVDQYCARAYRHLNFGKIERGEI